MSELFVLTSPELLDGYRLAGVQAFAVENAAAAEQWIRTRLQSGEGGLAAIEESILDGIGTGVMNRLRRSNELFYVAIPGADLGETDFDRERRLAEMIRRAIGFHISFEGQAALEDG